MKCCCVAVVALCAASSLGQVIAPEYATNYTIESLGSVPGVPSPYGGLTLLDGDPNTLLIGGAANTANAAIYSIGVTRNICGNISGFVGTATAIASAPHIDGGLAYGPNGVLFATAYPFNTLMMFKPGSTAPDKTVDLNLLDVVASTGSLAFVPEGQPNAGALKVLSYNAARVYELPLTPDANGTFDVGPAIETAVISGGPEGMAYVPAGSPLFPLPAVLISEYGSAAISAWDIDANGDPIPSTRRVVVSGLGGAEGAFLDTSSGDFVFSTFGGINEVYVLQGFAEVIVCDGVDFNNNEVFPEDQDILDFFSVLAGGECATCNDVDFNNNCVFPEDQDIIDYFNVLAGGTCP